MYLSCLLIDVGDNPDQPRPGRLWLRNLYYVHQRLCMAFPTTWQKENDPKFLKPYQPCGFHDPRPERCTIPATGPRPCVVSDAERPIHVARDADHNFLFRIDPQPGGSPVILVQSALKPNWDYAFQNASYLLACPSEVKEFEPDFQPGQSLRFRLVANPIKRLTKNSLERDGQPVAEKWVGKRIPVPADQLYEWLTRQAAPAGFSLLKESTTILPGYIYFRKHGNQREEESEGKQKDTGHRLRSVRYDGILHVTDTVRFRQALIEGIGPGKAFGFGLLSVAPLRGERREVGGET